MADTLDFGDLDLHLADHASRRLDDPDLPDPTLLKRSLEREVSIVHDNLSFTVGGEAAIDLFNAPGDEDPAGVFGPPPKKSLRQTTFAVRHPLHFASNSAWLAYRAAARVEADGGVKAAKFGLTGEAEGTASIRFHDYRRHGAGDLVGPTVARDLAAPRFVLSAADVRALSPGEALALEVNGRLGATLTLKWSDVFTGNNGALSALLAPGQDFGVKVGASLRARFKVEIEDHFLVVFSRRTPGEIRVAVWKSDDDALGVRARARIGVRFADLAQVEEALRAALDALLGAPLARVRELLDTPRVGDLDPRERAAAETLADRLGLTGRRLRLDSLRRKVDQLERDATELIVKLARQQVRFGVDFDYSRTRSDEAIVEVTLDEARLGRRFEDLHRALLSVDCERVLEEGASGAANGVTLQRFLQQETVKRTKSWGVSLDLGDFLRMGGKARTYVRETMRRDRRLDRSRFSFTALEGYAGRWGSETCDWKTTLSARSRAWTPGAAPTADALNYSLGFLFRYAKRRLSKGDVARLVDLAVLWGIVTAGGAPEARAHLERVAGRRRHVRVSCQLGFTKSTVGMLLALLARADTRGIGLALARALPRVGGEPGRDTPVVRQFLYGDLWRAYLEDPALSAGEVAAGAAAAARRAGHAGLAGFERRMRHWWTVGELVRRNGETRERWADLARGAAHLQDAIAGGGAHTGVREAARWMSRGWEHAFHQRALGVYLVEAVRAHPHLWGAVNRSLRVEYRERGQRVVLNLGSS